MSFQRQSSYIFIAQSILTLTCIQYKLAYFKLFICPFNVKRPKFVRTSNHDSAMNLWHSLQHLETPTYILQHSKTESLFKTDISKTAWINAYVLV